MDMEERDRGEEHGILDRLEDRIEAIAKAVVGRYDKDQDEAETPSGQRHDSHYENEKIKLDIHIDVNCCPPGERIPSTKPPKRDGRPTHETGTDRGPSKDDPPCLGGGLGSLDTPPSSWPGPRKDLYLPYLFMRANPGDTGTRPVVGPFWESPDIFVLPGVAPQNAPPIPAVLGGSAQAGADNTLYAHVWNFGLAPATDVLVEFYWFNPTLGFSGGSANLIGWAKTTLDQRGGSRPHKVVKCPASWPATYVNGGHECLVVRISDLVADPLSSPGWDASLNRHVAQRNIHVMSAAEAAARPTIGLEVGPLFGQPATLAVERAHPQTMPWLHLVTMNRGPTFGSGAGTGAVGITRPQQVGGAILNLGAVPNPQAAGLTAGQQAVHGDDQLVGFHATDPAPATGSAHVYRVSASQGNQVVGGYTVVVLGS